MTEENVRNRQIINKINMKTIAKLFILHFLSQSAHYGNELIENIEAALDYKWKPSPGMIYPLLRNMEENQLIEGWWDKPDVKSIRHYKITQEGLKHYEKIKLLNKPLLEESQSIINCTMKVIFKEKR